MMTLSAGLLASHLWPSQPDATSGAQSHAEADAASWAFQPSRSYQTVRAKSSKVSKRTSSRTSPCTRQVSARGGWYARAWPHLHDADSALLEGAVLQVVGADVAIFAPVAREHAAHTGSAPGRGGEREREGAGEGEGGRGREEGGEKEGGGEQGRDRDRKLAKQHRRWINDTWWEHKGAVRLTS